MCLCVVGVVCMTLKSWGDIQAALRVWKWLSCPDAPFSWEAQFMLISHTMLSLVHSCCAEGLPLGVDYVTRPAAGVPEESKGRKGRKPSLMSAAFDMWCKCEPKLVTLQSTAAGEGWGRTTEDGRQTDRQTDCCLTIWSWSSLVEIHNNFFGQINLMLTQYFRKQVQWA